MAENKMQPTDASVDDFIAKQSARRQGEARTLIEVMRRITGEEPVLWGPSIIGFGNYQYKYASGHEGDAPVLGFSPRKAALTLYVYSDTEKSKTLIDKLGKFKMSKACIYVKKLSDINTDILKELCIESICFL